MANARELFLPEGTGGNGNGNGTTKWLGFVLLSLALAAGAIVYATQTRQIAALNKQKIDLLTRELQHEIRELDSQIDRLYRLRGRPGPNRDDGQGTRMPDLLQRQDTTEGAALHPDAAPGNADNGPQTPTQSESRVGGGDLPPPQPNPPTAR